MCNDVQQEVVIQRNKAVYRIIDDLTRNIDHSGVDLLKRV
jgi:hypothetical protein